MIINKKHEGRNRPGEGPKVLRITGGSGGRPTYEGEAVNWHVSPALTSVRRLRVMSVLCAYPSLRVPEIEMVLGIGLKLISSILWGMRNFRLVECRPSPRRPGRGGANALDWSVTESGRAWFWRFACMTRRYGTICCFGDGFLGDPDVSPWEALRRHGHDSLCRPAGLATAHFIADRGPVSRSTATRKLDVYSVAKYFHRWRRMGWLAPTPYLWIPRYRRLLYNEQPMMFTREGFQAIGRHVKAVCWAAHWCGYEGDTWVEGYLKELHPDWFVPCGLHE
jgi:hypothetical protein